jgi:hypothetical protein
VQNIGFTLKNWINRKFRVATEIGSKVFGHSLGSFYHIFEVENDPGSIVWNSDKLNAIMPFIGILGLWPDHGHKSMERRGLKLKLLGNLARLGIRSQVQVIAIVELKLIFAVLHMFNLKSVFYLVRILVKARFPDF